MGALDTVILFAYLALMVGSFGAFGLSLVNSFKRVISPALVIADPAGHLITWQKGYVAGPPGTPPR